VAASRSRSTFYGVLLALLAVLGMSVLTGWHAADLDDHTRVHLALEEHDLDTPEHSDHDDGVHIAAHEAGQGRDVASVAGLTTPLRAAALIWPVVEIAARPGIVPASLLRPPRGAA
jgi:hypothetical protein